LTAEEFVSRLEGVKRSGNGWEARCPSHKDRQASLSVDEGDDGRVLVKCHAGCQTADICYSLGLELSDLFTPDTTPLPLTEDRVEAIYEYHGKDGTPVFQVVRYKNPKTFRQRRMVDGEWVWNLQGVHRIPYRLPELFAGAAEGRSVWVTEGEKDADELARLGFVATCNPGGSSSWQDAYATYFYQLPWVMVVADCDKPGRKHAHEVAESIHKLGTKVKVIDLAPDRDDGYDLFDFVAEHGANGEATKALRELARTTNSWHPAVAEQERPLPIKGVSEFLDGIPKYDTDRDYLGPFLHGGYRVHVAGPIGHGKTSFLLETVSAALRGDSFLGWEGKGGLKALYLDLEMPPELLGQAVRDARLDRAEGFSLLHLPDGLRIDTHPEDRELLERAVEGFQILVIDPWYKLVEQELEYGSVRRIVACLDGIRARHPELCTLVGYHAQEPLSAADRLGISAISGFKAFHRPADIILTFQRTEGNESRIAWVKNRSPRLGVKYGETWKLEWERGRGFRRTDFVEEQGVIGALA